MKIVNFKEFLVLPAGTVYMKYEPCAFEDLCVKDASIDSDFFYSNITYELDCTSSYDFANKLFEAEENKISVNTNFNTLSRDGCFSDNQLFAVYEKEDVERLIAKLSDSLNGAYT